jgi:Bacterial inner membrane protein
MERMLALVIERPFATGAGLFGMLCLAAYPLFRARPLLLSAYLGNNLGFAAHYAMLGQATALMMNLMLGVQTLVALGLGRWPGLRWAYLRPRTVTSRRGGRDVAGVVVSALRNGDGALHAWTYARQ